MHDITLIYPPYPWEYTSPPLGLAYVAAVLRNSGYAMRILDMNPTHTDLEQLANELRTDKPKIVGISAMTNQAKATLEIAERVKMVDESIKVIVGGPHPTALPGEMLENTAIDFVCIGEGECTVNELVKSLLDGDKKFDSILGLAYRDKEGKVVRTSPRPFISDLDSIPFPAWDLLPLDKYRVAHTGLQKSLTFALLSSRGCPYRCIFCSSSLTMGRKFRMRSAENIFAEIQMLYDRFGMRQFDFVDDTITVDKERVGKICELIIESKTDVTWACNSTVRINDSVTLRKMKEAGCVRIDFGVESGDTDVLKIIRKGITIPQVIEAHRCAKEAGLKTCSFFMIGLPGQDMESVRKSISLMKQIDTDFPSFSIATPYPGTELYQMAKKNSWLKTSDWSKYLVLARGADYEPVMETDKMNQREIMKAHTLVAAQVARTVLRKHYGSKYYLNPRLYIDSLRSSQSPLNRRSLLRNFRRIPELVKQELRDGLRRVFSRQVMA